MGTMTIHRDISSAARRAAAAVLIAPLILVLAGSCWRLPTDAGPDAQAYTGHYAPPRRAPTDSLTVVSYNIQYGEDLPVAAADLRAIPRVRDADIYLLQEMDAAGTDSLARLLGCDYVYFRASVSPHDDRDFGNAVLSRWPIVAHEVFVLPHGAPLTGQQRVAVAADLDVGGRQMRAVSVHLSTVLASLTDRLDQAAAAADSLLAGAVPVVVGGDFNTISVYEATRLRQALRRHGLQEARLPTGATARRTLFGLIPMRWRLDRFYYAGLEPVVTGIASTAQASDHLPIWATFVWSQR
jgi:endonuclease/exonuclease/phosphatase family metal-dependent hydrolase